MKPRPDLNAILLTGIPKRAVPGFQNDTGPVKSDLLRLNVAIPPAEEPNDLGLVAGDPARRRPTRSRISVSPVGATRPSPAPRRRRDVDL